MKGSHAVLAVLLLTAISGASHAGPRTSASYAIVTDTNDSGGGRTTSASYSNDGSAGLLVDVSTVVSPAETAKSGYIGQLYEITALQLAASPTTISETGTRQLSAAQILDDATILGVASSSVSWSVQSGPITSIDSAGLATAAAVYVDTAASVQGTVAGLTGSLNLTVQDTIPDNFGTYAGDGLPDSWQSQYFGQNNPNASPNFVSDSSGLTNLFKYTAGLTPNDGTSRFNFTAVQVTGQPNQFTIAFNPTFPDRQYTIQFSTSLSSWQTLSGPVAGNGGTITFTDTNAGPPRKFFQVQITKP